MDALVRSHRLGRVGVGVIRGSGFGTLGERQHEQRPEPAREEDEQTGPQVDAGRAGVPAQQPEPVRLVPPLGLGEPEQNRALLPRLALGELAVDGGFGALVGQVFPPAADLCGAGAVHGAGVYRRPHEPSQFASGSSQIRLCPELSASGGAVIGSTATARPCTPPRGNSSVVKTCRYPQSRSCQRVVREPSGVTSQALSPRPPAGAAWLSVP